MSGSGDGSPQWSPGKSPGVDLGAKPPEADDKTDNECPLQLSSVWHNGWSENTLTSTPSQKRILIGFA